MCFGLALEQSSALNTIQKQKTLQLLLNKNSLH
jgi:hypothetical protein